MREVGGLSSIWNHRKATPKAAVSSVLESLEFITMANKPVESDMQAWSRSVAEQVVEAMYSAGILPEENVERAVVIAQEEILVRLSIREYGRYSLN
jgi:hypothetical protein